MPTAREGMAPIATQVRIEAKEKLKAITQHKKANVDTRWSMTRELETLIEKEHKRLKL